MNRIIWLIAAALLLAGCSKEKEVAPPAELVEFDAVISVKKVWSAGTKGGDDVLRLGLQPAVEGERVYVAGHGGDVQALELAGGRGLWRASTELALSGGPGAGEGLVVAGASSGEVVAIDAQSGAGTLARRGRRRGAGAARGRQRPGHRAHRGRAPARAPGLPTARKPGTTSSRCRD